MIYLMRIEISYLYTDKSLGTQKKNKAVLTDEHSLNSFRSIRLIEYYVEINSTSSAGTSRRRSSILTTTAPFSGNRSTTFPSPWGVRTRFLRRGNWRQASTYCSYS
jgi:hypothetical protein